MLTFLVFAILALALLLAYRLAEVVIGPDPYLASPWDPSDPPTWLRDTER